MTCPPLRCSKRKHVESAINDGVKRLRQHLHPLSPNAGCSVTPSPGTGSPTPTSTTPSPSSTPGQSTSTRGPPTPGTRVGASPSTAGKLKGVAYSGLESALRTLQIGAGAIPPLKPAIDEFVTCLGIVKAATRDDEEYDELTSDLTMLAGTLKEYLSELKLEDPSGNVACARIAQSIETEVAYIKKQKDRGKRKRAFESVEEKDDAIKRYRRIEGLFRQLQNEIGLQTLKNTNKQHEATLLRGMVSIDDARYDSSYSTAVKRRGCTTETRESLRADLQDWVKDPNGAKVYWLNGMAGTGKTTIAYSLCEWLEANRLLGASFFCSRVSSSCRNVNSVIPTIAYQLARHSPAFRSALCKVLEDDPDVGKLNVARQFEKLIREPIAASKDTVPGGIVIVVDALDECEDDYGVRLVLGTLLKFCASLPLKFFVTSRPEPAIQENMLSPTGYSPAVLYLHDIEQSIVEDDIKKYLLEALGSMPSPASREQIELLAKHAGKLFIYAATAVRYILSSKGNPTTRLDAMLEAHPQLASSQQANKRYKELDELYTTILAAALKYEELEADEMESMRLVLWTVVCAKEPMTTPTLASLVDLTEEQVASALNPLQSVLHVSEGSRLVSTLHASFPDYMLDQSRSGNFCCDRTQHNEFIAHHCFDVMKEQLRFNICNLGSSFVYDKDVPDLEQRIESRISPTLFYACQHWGEHLRLSGPSDTICNKLVEFLTQRLLFWMEVLNFQHCVATGVSILSHAKAWLLATKSSEHIQRYTTDARDFATRFSASACNRSTPHIYISMLPFCDKGSSVYAHYWRNTQGLMDVQGTAMGQRAQSAQATWMTEARVLSVGFSPDGTRIVSGSDDGTIRVRDTRTGGDVTGLFGGHTGSVRSVAFSPDGTRIVSGSNDATVRMWDALTGDVVARPFKGHTHRVKSVAFSPDGMRVVSGSDDCGIRVWDARNGDTIAGPFEGHTGSVKSVAFSPDGTRIVSGSVDCDIWVWDVRTGDPVAGPFKGHTAKVCSVAFSPNGVRVVSGSFDCSIRVWDMHTGQTVVGPFGEHTHFVKSVAFSPDGAHIVSGSYDKTIGVWDAHTGNVVAGPFEGHTEWVNSVAFSPDGTCIVSCSNDSTIRLWNMCIGNAVTRTFEGHTEAINSVAFSPDGIYIVSGSNDARVQLWDACTGDDLRIVEPFEGHTDRIKSVAFSPDGTHIASGSNDSTIRLWDAWGSKNLAKLLEGHTDSVRSVRFSPDGAYIASGSNDCTIRIWDARAGDTIAGPFKGHTDGINSVGFSPDGTRVVSGSTDRTIRVWDARTGLSLAGPLKGHTRSIRSVAFSPDGTRVVSGSKDRTIRVWDARTGESLAGPFEGHTRRVKSVAFSPDGTRVVSGSKDRTIRVWDARTGVALAGPFEGHTNSVKSVAFSPGGTRVVSGSGDLAIRVLSLRTDNINAVPYHRPTKALPQISTPFQGAIPSNSNQSQDTPHRPATALPIFTPHPSQQDISSANLTDVVTSFECNEDGWTTTDNVPLFWVPPDLRACLPHPHDTLVIGSQGTMFIDYRNLLLGERWFECYIPH